VDGRVYHRVVTDKPIWWREDICAENNVHVGIANEAYYLSADGRLMPAKKNEAPPDRRYFKQYRGKIAPHRNQWRAGCA
jgi:hypothetical protein